MLKMTAYLSAAYVLAGMCVCVGNGGGRLIRLFIYIFAIFNRKIIEFPY